MSTDWLGRIGIGTLAAIVISGTAAVGQDAFRLAEEPGPQAYQVTAHASITGKLLTPAGGEEATEWKLRSSADYKFDERRLPSGGRDARALRAVRKYAKASSATSVNDHKTTARLSPKMNLVVAEGRSSGVLFYSPSVPLTRETLDLLSSPGDPLAIAALLPLGQVEVGEKWNPDQWAMQMLTDTEAAVKSQITCELKSVSRKQARVEVSGHIEGASLGSASLIDVSGHFVFDLNAGYIRHLELQRTEKRSPGTVNPGLDIVATLEWDRTRTKSSLPADGELPDEPTAGMLVLEYRAPWGVELRHERDWHVFNETDHAAILRLVRGGTLVAQCNLARVAQVKPGTHTPESEFVGDIRATLGERLSAIEPGVTLQSEPLFIYQAVAHGKSDETDMRWTYFLCAAPSGHQVSMVFSVAESDAEAVAPLCETMARGVRIPQATRVSRSRK